MKEREFRGGNYVHPESSAEIEGGLSVLESKAGVKCSFFTSALPDQTNLDALRRLSQFLSELVEPERRED